MPPKIALLIHALNGGGAERLMSQLAARWSADYRVHLITWSTADSDHYTLPPAVERHGLNLQVPSKGPFSGLMANVARVRRLRRCLREVAPDFILSFSDQMNIVTLAAAAPLGKPVWIAEHSNPEKQRLSRLWETWRSRMYPRCSGCVALTPGIASFMQRWIPANRMRVIPPAIAPPESDARPSKEELQDPAFLFVGRLSQEKGVDVLLEAWRQVQSRLPRWKLWIAGDGAQRQALESQASGLQAVEFLGWTNDPWKLYRQSTCFVLPSRYEGFPVALLEAMSQGKAAIATRCSTAVDEIVAQAPALVAVEVDSAAALRDAMLRVADDVDLRQQLGENAIAVASRYSWERIGPEWDALLEEQRWKG